MPGVMEKPSFENYSPKKGKKYGRDVKDVKEDQEGKGSAKFKPGGKRSFLKKAKRFGKQGKLGKGFQVDAETYSYFVRVYELLRKDDFDTDEDRETFVENSLGSETKGKEVDLSSNQLVSRVIESILPMASEEIIDRFGQAFTPNLRTIVSDPFASHVLEKLLEVTSSDKWRSNAKLTTLFEKTSMFVLNNFEDFTFDKYGSFVMKKVLECLSGHVEAPNDPAAFKFKILKNSDLTLEVHGDRISNPKWETMLHNFATRFVAWPQFHDLKERPETSRLVQNVIQAVHRTTIKGSKELVNQIILRVLETLPESLEVKDNTHRILESCLPAADKKIFKMIFTKYYQGRLADYCVGPCFTLIKLISSAPEKENFEDIFDELAPHLNTKIIQQGKDALIHQLVVQCVAYKTKQEEFYKIIKAAKLKENFLMVLINMKSRKNDEDEDVEEKQVDKLTTSYYGTRAVEALMDFDNPQEIIKCIIDLDPVVLKSLCLDPKASFIFTKFYKTWNVTQKQKEKLLHKLKENLLELASTKFGSRIIDVVWLWADVPQKKIIADVLSERIPQLASNKHGKFLVETLGLHAFKKDTKEWSEHMGSQVKRKKDALDIAAQLGLNTGDKLASNTSLLESESDHVQQAKNKKNKRKSKNLDETILKSEPDDDLEMETPKKNKKKGKKSDGVSLSLNESILDNTVVEEEPETPRKKNKKRKSQATNEEEEAFDKSQEAFETPGKKKKHKKERKSEVCADNSAVLEESETPGKKKKKSRESEVLPTEEMETDNVVAETPKKKKKKNRESN